MTKPICILITGIPYSGKSIPAGVLHHMGAYFGDFILEPDPIYNRHDYYEHPGLVNVHGMITRTKHISGMIRAVFDYADYEKSFRYNWMTKDTLNIVLERNIHRLDKVWGLKDPRLCLPYLFEDFCAIASKYSSDIKLITCSRSLDEIYEHHKEDSNERYHGKLHEYLSIWKSLSDRVYDQFYGKKIELDFLHPIQEPEDFLQFMSDFSGLPVTDNARIFLEKMVEAKNYVS